VGQLPLASGVEPSGHVCSLLLSCAVPASVLSSDDVGEAKVRLFDGIAVSTANIRIPAKAKGKGKIIFVIGFCTISIAVIVCLTTRHVVDCDLGLSIVFSLT
jgi:hypothetical protein